MRMKILLAMAIGVLLLAPIASRADTCVSAFDNVSNATFQICYSNLSVDASGGTITLTAITSDLFGNAQKVNAGGLYGTGHFTSVTPGTWGAPPPNDCCDGFANPDNMIVDGGGVDFPLTFNWTGLATSVIFHAQGFNTCSAFVGLNFNGGSLTSISNDTFGPGCAPVPEPGSLALLGSGLIGLAGLLRRRFFG